MSYGYEYEGYEGHEGRDPYAPPEPYAPDGYPDGYSGLEPDSAGRGRRRKSAPEPEPVQYDPQWEHSGLGWDPQAWNEAQRQEQYRDEQIQGDSYRSTEEFRAEEYHADEYRGSEYRADRYDEPDRDRDAFVATEPRPEPERDRDRDRESEFQPESEPEAEYPSERAAALVATTPALSGRGAFGAAGLAVVTGIGAIAATPVLAVVAALTQLGLAVGWARAVGLPDTRRTVVLTAAIGLAASALAYRLVSERAAGAMGAALGVGFVFLATDQLFRKDTGAGRQRSEALATAVTGAAFVVLPAGYLVAQRQDSALAGACALAAAVAVLCSALVGGGRPIGILAGTVAATAVGTLTATSLASAAGAKGGAAGGFAAGIFAVVAARIADRLGAEGGDVRIASQALPVAFSAIGAVMVTQMLR
jgi:hypothetical protein